VVLNQSRSSFIVTEVGKTHQDEVDFAIAIYAVKLQIPNSAYSCDQHFL